MKSIKKNFIYNLIYQVFVMATPLVTTPYISRCLGAERIGEYSYAYSLVSYFMIVAILGTATYAEREIARYQDDKEKRSYRFWDLFTLRVITSFICIVFYFIFISITNNDYLLSLIVSLNILSVALDTVWVFQGMEEFGKISVRNMFVKIVVIASTFIFVKSPNDIYIYTLIMSLSPVLSALTLLPFIPKFISKPNFKKIKPFKDFRNILRLFVPTVAISVYTVLDVTMIGVFTTTKVENGYYEQATKLSKTALTIITTLSTVMLPRISYYFEKDEKDKIQEYMLKSYQFALFLGFPICFGLIGISSNLVPWFYGSGYDKVAMLLNLSSFLVIAIGLSNITGMQYLVPTMQQDKLTISVVIGAAINFVCNLILIPNFYSSGAMLASVIAEFSVTAIQFYFVKKQLSFKKILTFVPKYLISGLLMLILLRVEEQYLSSSVLSTLIMIISGALLYFIVLIIMRDKLIFEAFGQVLTKAKAYLKKNK